MTDVSVSTCSEFPIPHRTAYRASVIESCRAGKTYSNGNDDIPCPNAPQPFDDRLGFETELRDDRKLQPGATGELHF